MSAARQRLLALNDDPCQYERSVAETEALQLAAVRELFETRVDQVSLLKRRADDAGMRELRGHADLVPLLFPHTAYKSYPQSFVDRGQWQRLLKWLAAVSTAALDDVDLSGVQNIDDWVDRLWQAGHEVMATSGTSGKCSFLNRSRADRDTQRRYLAQVMGGFVGLRPNADRAVFQLFPPSGPNNGVLSAQLNAELWGRPGDIHFLGDEPLRISEISRAAVLRQRMRDGQATPDEIAASEAASRDKAARLQATLDALIERILERRREPLFVAAPWALHWQIVERARARGIADGEFDGRTLVAAGGGTKGAVLPDDYEAQINRFYGAVRRPKNYGMTEMLLLWPRCEAQRYHQPAGVIGLLLDDSGERLLPREGRVQGRFAFVDLALEGRWGGVISGDRVTMDFAETCACGRRGPTLLEPIERHAPPGQDDHIGCAGTIDAYLRGAA